MEVIFFSMKKKRIHDFFKVYAFSYSISEKIASKGIYLQTVLERETDDKGNGIFSFSRGKILHLYSVFCETVWNEKLTRSRAPDGRKCRDEEVALFLYFCVTAKCDS